MKLSLDTISELCTNETSLDDLDKQVTFEATDIVVQTSLRQASEFENELENGDNSSISKNLIRLPSGDVLTLDTNETCLDDLNSEQDESEILPSSPVNLIRLASGDILALHTEETCLDDLVDVKVSKIFFVFFRMKTLSPVQ